jgi:hypothetical protein
MNNRIKAPNLITTKIKSAKIGPNIAKTKKARIAGTSPDAGAPFIVKVLYPVKTNKKLKRERAEKKAVKQYIKKNNNCFALV